MEKHLDVLGYLVAALVFSVGFVSARVHDEASHTISELKSDSQRLSDAVQTGQPVDPREIEVAGNDYTDSGDPVTRLSRAVNMALFLAITIVAADAVYLMTRKGEQGVPEHAPVLIGALFGSSALLAWVSEADTRRIRKVQRRDLRRTSVGRVVELSSSLANHQLDTASLTLNALESELPSWTFIEESRALIEVFEGNADRALDRLQQIPKDVAVYESPMIFTSCALTLNRTAEALQEMTWRTQRPNRRYEVQRLILGLGLTRGHPEAIFFDPQDLALQPPDDGSSLGAVLAGLPGLTQLDSLVTSWVGDVPTPDQQHVADAAVPLRLVLAVAASADDPVGSTGAVPPAKIMQIMGEIGDARSFEAAGLLLLCTGHSREAFRAFERAISLAPASAEAHWGHAISARRTGWVDYADTALKRAKLLNQHSRITQITEILWDKTGHYASGGIASLMLDVRSRYDVFRAALLGQGRGMTFGDTRACDRTMTRLYGLALASGKAPIDLGDFQ